MRNIILSKILTQMKKASHNSWTYLRPKKWWMRLIAFTARCQRKDILQQYFDHNVRCFDLRVRFDKHGNPILAHGIIEYDADKDYLYHILSILNGRSELIDPVYIRLIHEVRSERNYTQQSVLRFQAFCKEVEKEFPAIYFFGGENLLPGNKRRVDYELHGKHPSILELYASVTKPKVLDDWWPWLYAVTHNRMNIAKGTDREFLMMDFVDIA